MSRVGFEPTIPVFERAKMVHDLDRAATGIDRRYYYCSKMYRVYFDFFERVVGGLQ
jgi:hypothetical protein